MLKQNKNTAHVIFDAKWVWYERPVAICFTLLNSPLGAFTDPGKYALAVFAVAAFLWLTNVCPIAVTGIIVLFMLQLTAGISVSTTTNKAISFIEWTTWRLPAVVIILAICLATLLFII